MTFRDFFQCATRNPPFPYQEALAEAELGHGVLTAPTGAGKTAAAVLAWLWQLMNRPERTPRRLVFCLPQRVLVEQAFQEVEKWLRNLKELLPEGIQVHALLGGYVDESWEYHPESPAILIGTQDQLLSRALNRGYAMSRFRWPIHFGLLHSDVQWVFDEIQLMGPGLITSAQLHGLRNKLDNFGQAGSLWMSATTNLQWLDTVDHRTSERPLQVHSLSRDDLEALAPRIHAHKPLYKLPLTLDSTTEGALKDYLKALVRSIQEIHVPGRFTLVIVNTVSRARRLYKELRKALPDEKLLLLHSRFRPVDRRAILDDVLDPDAPGKLVISTQVVEAGVDISADRMITELAPRASLIQRFGRCNRRGTIPDAEVHWIDLVDKAVAPYEPEELDAGRGLLESLESVEPAKFPAEVEEPWPLYDTLRRRDLLELFDTTSDLSGLDLDVGRFIRDGEDRDVFLFWRELAPGSKPERQMEAPDKQEICSAPLHEVLAQLNKEGLELWMLDDLRARDAQWRLARRTDLVPGRVFLVPTRCGLYTPQTGWDPRTKQKNPVPELPMANRGHTSPFPSLASDFKSDEGRYISLADHTSHVRLELEEILAGVLNLNLPPKVLDRLRLAALWHDVGKAHDVFQQTMMRNAEHVDSTAIWAKRAGRAFHKRRYFRHELASALVGWQHGLETLELFLVAGHHGKARVSVRSFPDEFNSGDSVAVLGVMEGDRVAPTSLPGLELPETTITLKPLAMGDGSWSERMLALRDELGPFRLAYLEAIVRAADVRASKEEKTDGKYC